MRQTAAAGRAATYAKWRLHGEYLLMQGYRPVFLVLREDNLRQAAKQCQEGGWTIYAGPSAFDYLRELTGVDLKAWLVAQGEVESRVV